MSTRLAHVVRRRRLELGLTKDEAARLGKVSLSTWHTIENAHPESTFREITLVGVASALEVDVDLIFDLAGVELPARSPEDPSSPPGKAPTREDALERIHRYLGRLSFRQITVVADLVEVLAREETAVSTDTAKETDRE